jgi:NAD(P)-dependent dehydrogenase (short-subunit alcohol dehydrogenase family)
VTSGVSWKATAYWGLYATSKAGLNTLVRTYANETESTSVRVNLLSPGATRTRMRAAAMPGEDPETLPAPEEIAEALLPMVSAACRESGKVYDFRRKRFLSFQEPVG